MKTYVAKKISDPIRIIDARWDNIPAALLDFRFEDYYPSLYKTEFRMVHSDDGFFVKMSSTEWPLRAECVSRNQEVCEDSCMEFFFTPNLTDAKYFNVEVNAIGISLFGIGEGRVGRKKINIANSGVKIETLIHPEEGWEMMFFFPYSYVSKYFSEVTREWKANLYKIGNSTARKHYSIWNPMELELPDFHRPEFFGRIILSDGE